MLPLPLDNLPAAPSAEETKGESTAVDVPSVSIAADVDTATAADVIAGAAKEEAAEETLKRKEAEAGDAEGGETRTKSAKVAPDAAADAAAKATAA